MKKLCYAITLFISVFTFSSYKCIAQENYDGYNKDSVYPVNDAYKMYKKIVWRRMDMEEKRNLPFFARGSELPTIIINAVKNGLLFPYTNDSVNTRMSKETFLENLKLEEEGGGLTQEEIDMGFGGGEDDFFDDSGESDEEPTEAVVESVEFSSRDFSIAELKEEMYFDRMRSRTYYDIQVFTLFLPADKNPALFEKPLASFKYKDLAMLFKSMPREAIWYNTQNLAEHRNMTDAFNLRLFSANLTKYANPNDDRIVDIYNKTRRDGIIASKQLEDDMVEFENELWEF